MLRVSWFRRHMAPVASVTLCAFWNAFLVSSLSRAQQGGGEAPPAATEDARGSANASYTAASRASLAQRAATSAPSAQPAPAKVGEATEAPPELAEVEKALASLPSGGGGVSPQAAALPSGAATQLGMGESFSTQLSTGGAGYSVPLTLLGARGRVQPRLDLSLQLCGRLRFGRPRLVVRRRRRSRAKPIAVSLPTMTARAGTLGRTASRSAAWSSSPSAR